MKRILGLILLVVLFSCSEQPELFDKEKDRIIGEVRDMLRNYSDDVRKTGLMAEFAYLDSSEEFFWVAPGYSSPLSFDSVASIVKENSRKSVSRQFVELSPDYSSFKFTRDIHRHNFIDNGRFDPNGIEGPSH